MSFGTISVAITNKAVMNVEGPNTTIDTLQNKATTVTYMLTNTGTGNLTNLSIVSDPQDIDDNVKIDKRDLSDCNSSLPISPDESCNIVLTMEFPGIKDGIVVSGGSILGGNANTQAQYQDITNGNKYKVVFTVKNKGGAPLSDLDINKLPWAVRVVVGRPVIESRYSGLTIRTNLHDDFADSIY